MKTYFTADPHFGHVNMTEEGKDLCKRGFKTVDEMNKALLEGINSTVSSADRLVVLGDVVMGKLESNIHLLSGIRAAEVLLVPGNHDRFSMAYHHKGAEAEHAVKREQMAEFYEIDWRFTVVRDDQPSVWEGEELGLGEPLDAVLFSHYPYVGDHTSDDRYAHLRAPDEGLPIIHGHVHDSWRINGRMFNVGVDVNEFKPVSEEELADWVRSLD
jgi:calcineurin-like phosphoesterase family protein